MIFLSGSPPRAREGQRGEHMYQDVVRITPACAGRTLMAKFEQSGLEDHPRVRGKDFQVL